jgi:hypothetical protein
VYASVIKTAVWILIIVELWLLLQVPAVGDALFSFIVGGEVPGTSKILTLNEMILFLTGLFVLAAGLLFHREINMLVGGMRRPQKQVVAHVVAKAPQPQASKPKRLKASRVTRRQSVVRPLLRKTISVLVDLKTISMYWLSVGLAQLQKVARHGAVTGAYYVQQGWTTAVTHAKAFWKWLRPRIERFDRWLDHTLHQNDKAASVLSFGSEMTKTVKAWVAYGRMLKDKYLQSK